MWMRFVGVDHIEPLLVNECSYNLITERLSCGGHTVNGIPRGFLQEK
jgi:hypothetical protein